MIHDTLYSSRAAVNKLGGSPGPHCEDSLKLLHDVSVVQTLRSRLRVAGVLLVVRRVLLAVEIIGLHPHFPRALSGKVHHLLGLRRFRLLAQLVQLGRPLDGQGVHGQVVRIQLLDARKGVLHIPQGLPRKAQDHVHIHRIKACLPYLAIRPNHVPSAVGPPDAAQGFIVHGLGVDGNAAHAMLPKHFQHFRRDGIRPARFHRKFSLAGKALLRRFDHLRQLLHAKGRRRPPADVDAAHPIPRQRWRA